MDPGRRRVLAGVGAAVAALAAVVALLAVGDGDDGAPSTAATSATHGRRSTTTMPSATSSTTSTTGPASAPRPEEVDGEGAVLTATRGPARPAAACPALAEPGYGAECGTAGDLVWLIESSRDTGGLRVTVFEPAGPGTVRPALGVVDDGPDGAVRFAAITARAVDVSGDGVDELVVGFRGQGSGGSLDVDVVGHSEGGPERGGPDAEVVVHRTLDQGQATATAGRLDLWSAVYGPGDARCCPSVWRHEVVTFVDGAWRVVASTDERLSAPPEGDLG